MFILMVQYIKENGLMINKMEKDKKNLQMVHIMKDSLKKGKKMDLENILGVMGKCMKDILKIIIFKEKGNLSKIIFISKYTWSDGRSYEGEWLNGGMNGQGIMKWPDGRKYEGNYLSDKKHGFGILEWRNLLLLNVR